MPFPWHGLMLCCVYFTFEMVLYVPVRSNMVLYIPTKWGNSPALPGHLSHSCMSQVKCADMPLPLELKQSFPVERMKIKSARAGSPPPSENYLDYLTTWPPNCVHFKAAPKR